MRTMLRSIPLFTVSAMLAALHAQDTRSVTEPHFPAICSLLTAQLSAPQGALPSASERMPDTARIQSAIDKCEPGKAVALRPAGGKSIFLAGPLTLKPGVTLLVEA